MHSITFEQPAPVVGDREWAIQWTQQREINVLITPGLFSWPNLHNQTQARDWRCLARGPCPTLDIGAVVMTFECCAVAAWTGTGLLTVCRESFAVKALPVIPPQSWGHEGAYHNDPFPVPTIHCPLFLPNMSTLRPKRHVIQLPFLLRSGNMYLLFLFCFSILPPLALLSCFIHFPYTSSFYPSSLVLPTSLYWRAHSLQTCSPFFIWTQYLLPCIYCLL